MKKKSKSIKKMRIIQEKPLTNKDGEVRELTAKDFSRMRPAREVLSPKLYEGLLSLKKVGQRGPQKKPTKVSVTLRFSPEVVEYFKSTGTGWQTKMDDALKEWIKKRKRAA